MARFWTYLARAATVSVAAVMCTLVTPFHTATATPINQATPVNEATLAPAEDAQSGAAQSGGDVSSGGGQTEARPSVIGEAAEDDGFAVVINHVTPDVLTDEKQVQLNVTITNTSEQVAEGLTLTVGMQAATPVTASQLTNFLTGQAGDGLTVAQVDGPERLAAGSQWTTVVTVNRDQLPLGDTFQWGPRGISVQAQAGNSEAEGTGRSLMIWDSGYQVEPTRIGAIVPMTEQSGDVDVAALARLVSLLGVSMAVDSALLEPVRSIVEAEVPMSGALTLEATESNPVNVVTDLQEILLTQANELVILPREDADMGVLAASNAEGLATLANDSVTTATDLREALEQGRVVTALPDQTDPSQPSPNPSTSPSGSPPPPPPAPDDMDADVTLAAVEGEASPMVTTIMWPDEDTFGLQILQNTDATVIAPPGALSPTEELTFTSVAPVNVDPETGATALPADQGTTVLTSQASFSDLLAWEPTQPADQFLLEQTLAALTAIITKEKPNESRTLLAVVERGTGLDLPLSNRLSALLDARWVTPVTVSEVAGSEVTDVDRGVVANAAWDTTDQAAFSTIQNATNRLFQMADAATEPERARQLVEDQVLKAVSTSNSADLSASANQLNTLAAQWYSQVRIEPATTVNLINKTAQFPVRVTNDLPWDVRIQVSLDPEDQRLSAQASEITVVPAGQTVTVDVAVRAIGSGNISVGYHLLTPSGFTIDQSQSVIVRLRAGWEDRFTLAMAIAVGILFVAGVVRTVRQRIKHGSTIVGTPQLPAQALGQHPARRDVSVKEDHESQ